jgi:hypothetical protein
VQPGYALPRLPSNRLGPTADWNATIGFQVHGWKLAAFAWVEGDVQQPRADWGG